MPNWRDIILKEFPTQVARLTLVADPDSLLLEEGILRALRDRGFDLIAFEDPIEFRFAYESQYRNVWDQGKMTDLVVVLRSRQQDLKSLPYDLYHAGRKVAFDLTDVFPNLSYPVVEALSRAHFDALYEAQAQYSPARMGDSQTKDFILLHVFEMEPKLVKEPAHLLHALMRKHYRQMDFPKMLDDRLIEVLRQNGHFTDWPLEFIVPDRLAFYEFLQERWRIFIERTSKSPQEIGEDSASYGLKHNGPVSLPFDHADVRIYLDNLFNEGLLQPVAPPDKGTTPQWVNAGVSRADAQDQSERAARLLVSLKAVVPSMDATHRDWMLFAQRLAELEALCRTNPRVDASVGTQRQQVAEQTDAVFGEWMMSRYQTLHNQPPDPPVMVHHVPRFIARCLEEKPKDRIALVVLDGLSLGQWVVLRDILRKQAPGIRCDEHAVFAWVPTVTCVSRQALFAGKVPLYFPDTINTTSNDQSAWRQFWAARGINPAEVAFASGLEMDELDSVKVIAEDTQCRMLGIVVNTVDEIMHGMQLGMAGMYSQVEQWASSGLVHEIAAFLLKSGFRVFLAADHGNTEACGIGNPAEGSLAETKGQRVRIYPNDSLRQTVRHAYPDSIEWTPTGLPPAYFPLIVPRGKAFVTEGDVIVSHGGLSIEEVIVPFVEISFSRT